MSHLEAEVQLGTNHLTKLANLAELTNRQKTVATAKHQYECIKPPACP